MCGLLGLGGVKGLAFRSFFLESRTRGPVTELLLLDDLGLFRRFSFSLSSSFRLLRFFFSSGLLGAECPDSPVAVVSSTSTSTVSGSFAPGSGLGAFAEGPALDLLANLSGLLGRSALLPRSFLVGFGVVAWEFSTNETLPFALAGVGSGGAFGITGALGGGKTRSETVGRLTSLGRGPRSGAGGFVSTGRLGWLAEAEDVLASGLGSDGLVSLCLVLGWLLGLLPTARAVPLSFLGLSTIFLFKGSFSAPPATDALGVLTSLPLAASISRA